MLVFALIINLIIMVCEIYVLGHIKKKIDILKYYTYLQNFLALFASAVAVMGILCQDPVSEYVRGIRYIATCSLAATTFIFVFFLGAGKKVAITEDDFTKGCTPKRANIILHYLCPALSVVSFVFFEREISLSQGMWTSLAAAPSCVYWIIYATASAAKLWEEPYQFESDKNKGILPRILTYLLIPLSFVAISFVLWNVK